MVVDLSYVYGCTGTGSYESLESKMREAGNFMGVQKGKKKEKAAAKKMSMKKKTACIAGGCVVFLLLVYCGISVFFLSHFLINTKINGYDFSAKTSVEAEAFFQTQIKEYTLVIHDKDGNQDTIASEDISLEYKESEEVQNVLKKQNAFLWPKSIFFGNSENVDIDFSYDEAKLQQKIDSLEAVTVEQVPAESAYPEFDGEQFVVHEEVYGTAVELEILEDTIKSAIMQLEPEVDLMEEGCYMVPKYTTDSEEVKQACNEMNQYCQASITYSMDEPVVVDKTVISTWLSVDDDMKVKLDEAAIKKWLEEFGDKYDTMGTTRNFTTPNGKAASVSGGTYGWSIDEDTEFTALLDAVKNGKVVTKEPAYYIGGTAATHAMPDWGSTYAEVDLSQQHMWYVSNGSVALETDVITGEPIPERVTPEGTYSILEKSLDKILVGEVIPETGQPEYETHVTYWMRVTWSGIGFHDAIWQSAFGGTLYQIHNIGSHGCINMPLDMAGALYDMIEVGTPVIIHY